MTDTAIYSSLASVKAKERENDGVFCQSRVKENETIYGAVFACMRELGF